MNFFKKKIKDNYTFKQTEPKKQYIAGWEVNLDGKEHYQSFIETQITDKITAENLYSHIVLTFNENNFLECAESKDEDGNVEELIIRNNHIQYKELIRSSILKKVKMEKTGLEETYLPTF